MQKKYEKIIKQFGFAIKKRRLELQLSQEKLAEKADLHRTYIGDIERGLRNPSLINIGRIASALNIRISDLFSQYCGF